MEMKQSWNQTPNLLIMTARIFTNDLDSTLVLQNSDILRGKNSIFFKQIKLIKWNSGSGIVWNFTFFTLMF